MRDIILTSRFYDASATQAADLRAAFYANGPSGQCESFRGQRDAAAEFVVDAKSFPALGRLRRPTMQQSQRNFAPQPPQLHILGRTE